MDMILKSNSKDTNDSLYHSDFQLWLEQTTNLIRQRNFDGLDIEYLLEELDDMGRSDKRSLENNLIRLLQHLLKWKYQPNKRTNSWKASITEHSLRLNRAFKQSPSLRRYFEEVFDECYLESRLIASQETDIALEIFPKVCPFAISDVLDPQYLPQSEIL